MRDDRTAITPAAAWALLGIARTDDARAIRHAYVAILRTIDIEAEPWRFAALRDAYDLVRARDDMPITPRAAASPDVDFPDLPPSADRAVIEDCAARIAALLDGERPAAEIEDELVDRTLRLVAEIERDTIDRQVEGEAWLAATIAVHMPRSDAMIAPVVASFRWQARAYGETRPAETSKIMDRMRDLNFARLLVLHDAGRHHLAWRTLQRAPRRRLMQRPDFAALAALDAFFREAGWMPVVAGVAFDPTIVTAWQDELRTHDTALDRWRAKRRRARWVRTAGTALWIFVAVSVSGAVAMMVLL